MVVDVAVNVVDVTAHVNVAGVPILAFGGVTVCVNVTAAVVVQPLVGSVTVTVYVAGLVTVWLAVVIPPPQLNVAPLVVDDAAKTSLVAAQVKTVGGAMLALGAVIFCVTVADAVLVQPLPGLVTVTVYVPMLETVLIAVVTPPPQLKVALLVVEEAVNASLVLAQVNTAGAVILARGVAIF